MVSDPAYGVAVYTRHRLYGYVKDWTNRHVGVVSVDFPSIGILMLPRILFSGPHKTYGYIPWDDSGDLLFQRLPLAETASDKAS